MPQPSRPSGTPTEWFFGTETTDPYASTPATVTPGCVVCAAAVPSPTVSAESNASISAVTVTSVAATPVAAVHLYRMGVYKPNIIYTQTNLTGTYSDIDESPDTPDADALVPTGGAIVVRMGFENHTQPMRTEIGDQKIRIVVNAP